MIAVVVVTVVGSRKLSTRTLTPGLRSAARLGVRQLHIASAVVRIAVNSNLNLSCSAHILGRIQAVVTPAPGAVVSAQTDPTVGAIAIGINVREVAVATCHTDLQRI